MALIRRPPRLPRLGRPRFIITDADYERALGSAYFDAEGGLKASSRSTPAALPRIPLGTWRVDDFAGLHGRSLAILQRLKPRALIPREFEWDDIDGSFDRTKWNDIGQYVAWLTVGLSAPPLEVLETESHALAVSNGHRRLVAADRAGVSVLAWVSPIGRHPRGLLDAQGRVMLVGMTYEMATGKKWSPSVATPIRNLSRGSRLRR